LLPSNKKFSYDLNYTFTDSYDANTCDQDELDSYSDNECRLTNNVLSTAKVRVPRHAINSKINYFHNGNIKSSLKAQYRSSMRDFGNQNNNWTDVILKERLVLDYIFNMKFKDSLNFNFTINNLLDKKYEEVYQYSSPSRSLFFGIKSIR
jgi:outer membrane cobalamin receptor